MGYGSLAFLIMLFLLIRIGVLYGLRIPLIFIGLLVIGRFTLPAMLGPYRFELFVTFLAIVLALIDRFKSIRWNSM